VVRAGSQRNATGWMICGAAAMVLSDLTTYSSLIFDPVIFALAVLTAGQRLDWSAARSRLTTLLAYAVTAVAILARVGGPKYSQGLAHTVLDRIDGTSTMASVVSQAWAWTGLIVVLAGVALVIGLICERGAAPKLLLATMLVAALIVPAEQARIHTLTSLDKHADLGAWFAAIAAGYAADRLIRTWRAPWSRALICVTGAAALYFPAVTGAAQSASLSQWPDAASFVTWLRPVADHSSGPMLIETPSIAEYYLSAGAQWKRWSSTFNITLPSGRDVEHSGKISYPGQPLTYRKFIERDYFSVIALDHGKASVLDQSIVRYIARNHDYRPEGIVPYGDRGYSVWVLTKAGR
jgi:hypothetical protein